MTITTSRETEVNDRITPNDLAAEMASTKLREGYPTTEVTRITPGLAAIWLKRNKQNRPIRDVRVDQFAREMAAGKWTVTNQGIGFDIFGELVDGQHRLLAVIKAGVAVDMLVAYGLEPAARANIDTGRARSPGDMLHLLDGVKNASCVAAVVRLAIAWRAGDKAVSGYHATHTEIREFVRDYPHPQLLTRAVEIYTIARRPENRSLARPALIALAFLVCAEIDREAAEEFYVVKLLGRAGLVDLDPVIALQRRLSWEASNKGHRADLAKLAYIFAAWNKHRRGETAQKLQAPDGGYSHTNFTMPR